MKNKCSASSNAAKTTQNKNMCIHICIHIFIHTKKRWGKAAYETFAGLRIEQCKGKYVLLTKVQILLKFHKILC